MNRHFQVWPKGLPKSLTVPQTPLHDNLWVTARRYPEKTAIDYYGFTLSFRQLQDEVEALAGYLQQQCGMKKGDRIALYMQNSVQYIVGFYAVLWGGGVVVPVNPMNVTDELRFLMQDSGANVVIAGQELYAQAAPLLEEGIVREVIVAAYSDYQAEGNFAGMPDPPDVVRLPRISLAGQKGATHWHEAIGLRLKPHVVETGPEDMAVLPYTSGTTGQPKGCIHTHFSVQAGTMSATVWQHLTSDSIVLCTLPLFHVTGMVHSMNAPIQTGSTIVVMTRWNRDAAAQLIQRTGATHWKLIATMVIDFLAHPNLADYDLSSLCSVGGGGAPVPRAVAEKFQATLGLPYIEGYGLSETISTSHSNPPDRPKDQCAGIPVFGVDARVVHPDTLKELTPGEDGEIVVNGPQVMKGYWQRPGDNDRAFVELDGKVFLRTGDIGRVDEEGYFYIVDRVKRMINASGFKVWPVEVESVLHKHPAIQQVCVIAVPDERRGETVKAFVVLNDAARGQVTEEEIIDWSKQHMAAYKYPRRVELVESLPMSGSGKVLWRKLQEQEAEKLKRAQSS